MNIMNTVHKLIYFDFEEVHAPPDSKECHRIDRRQTFIDMYRNLLWFGRACTPVRFVWTTK